MALTNAISANFLLSIQVIFYITMGMPDRVAQIDIVGHSTATMEDYWSIILRADGGRNVIDVGSKRMSL